MNSCIFAGAAALNLNGIKKLLVNALCAFFFKGNLVFSNGPESLPKCPLYCAILCNLIFYNFILTKELFTKALRGLETYVLDNSNICGKLFSSLQSPTSFA